TARKAASMDPEHDRQPALAGRVHRRIDIQEKTVLAGFTILENHVVKGLILSAVGAVLGCVAFSCPARGRLRRTPSKIADGKVKAVPGMPSLSRRLWFCPALHLVWS